MTGCNQHFFSAHGYILSKRVATCQGIPHCVRRVETTYRYTRGYSFQRAPHACAYFASTSPTSTQEGGAATVFAKGESEDESMDGCVSPSGSGCRRCTLAWLPDPGSPRQIRIARFRWETPVRWRQTHLSCAMRRVCV